ncbi:hypothetical protein SEUCBS140593_010721 [Sporothrix eucalyptigena]|uniref:Alcohol dehydrogenase-like N-terminal domain-containing protein n=1 Tax=Sporothrix eucalyptigena TaxID=1812306 RepID=A0ABP0D3U4_9PEZI
MADQADTIAATTASDAPPPTAPANPSSALPSSSSSSLPSSQRVLLLHAPKQPYHVTHDYAVPVFVHSRELLVRTRAIGLNPIDWKAPDFNFGLPELPYIAGRELAGDVTVLNDGASRLQKGDRVLAISTDYRDLRKGAYQEYVVAWDFNTVRLPRHMSYEAGATIGVAFVAAVLALGVNLGVDFSSVEDGPDLLRLVRSLSSIESPLPADIREECLSGIDVSDRARPGDWIAIWGASSTSAHMAIQLARLAGLRVAAVVDTAKHGLRLAGHNDAFKSFYSHPSSSATPPWQPDLLVDSHDPERAVTILRSSLGRKLRFAFDTTGRNTATQLLQALACTPSTKEGEKKAPSNPPSPPATPRASDAGAAPGIESLSLSTTAPSTPKSHLVGLTGLPKGAPPPGGVFHNVPIKLFHEVPDVGEALSVWLENLLESGRLIPPVVAGVETGLESVNAALDRMRAYEISGGRLVVRLEDKRTEELVV